MSIIVEKKSAGSVTDPSAGSGAIFIDTTGQLAVKQPDGTSGTIPTVASSDTQVIYNSNGNLVGSSGLTYNGTTHVLSATAFSGDAGNLNNIPAANISGTVMFASSAIDSAYATFAYNVLNNAQPNITSVGTLTTLNVSGNLGVTGNLNVTGNVNYSNVADLIVGDPLIYMGANNTGNLYDLGTVASYNDGTYKHTGLARNHSTGVWTFFDGVTTEPTTTINWAQATYPNVKMGNLSSTGNVTASYFLGNGSQLTGLNTSSISNGTSNVNISTSGGNVQLVSAGNIIGNITGTGANITGTLSVSGNANVGNIGATSVVASNLVAASSTMNIATLTASTINIGGAASTQINIGSPGTTSNSVNYTMNLFQFGGAYDAFSTRTLNFGTDGAYNVGQVRLNVGGQYSNTYSNIYGIINVANTSSLVGSINTVLLSATGNVTVANLITGGYVLATGNVTGGNLTTGGLITVTGNANIGNIGTGGLITATGNLTAANIITGGLITATGNLTAGNIITGGLISATGNITAGNVSASGNITANNFVSTGTSGNITGANVIFANSITTTGSVAFGNLVVLSGGNASATGTGIAFPATQNASTDANTLDDYEEGTWTPSLGGTATYTEQAGSYTKVGRLIIASFAITVNSIGTGSTNSISGLPFAVGGTSQGSGGQVGYYTSLATSVVTLSLRVDLGSTTIGIAGATAAATGLNAGLTIFGNSARLIGSIVYQTT